ncbi:MAG TPA: DUF2442 domain-containing protein [Planctomycetota bacterium]|nr:DUF2442 domain-containing protein [Planctomycetota bacterium]
MSSSFSERKASAQDVRFTEHELVVELTDGRTILTPLAWYPKLMHATPTQRSQWRLVGRGGGVHWAALDEDLSVEGMLRGLPSREASKSAPRYPLARAPSTVRDRKR